MTSSISRSRTNYEVHVSTCNDELVVGKCLYALTELFGNITVHDFGSTDSTPEEVKKFPVNYVDVGKLAPFEYTQYKGSIGAEADKVFWVDSDEVYPLEQLIKIKTVLEIPESLFLCGYWRNLLPEGGEATKLMHRGRILWKPSRFVLHRAWPREHLSGDITKLENKTYTRLSENLKVWCYHYVLMQRSNTPEDRYRAHKRSARQLQVEQNEKT
jgi:hypothetical protein